MGIPLAIHVLFDLMAVTLAGVGGWLIYKWRFQDALEQTAARIGKGYFLALSFGSIGGAFMLGSLNLYLSGIYEVGRSILGALSGATFIVEVYKFRQGIAGSTGYIYVVPFCISVIVGRLGCFLSGLDDNTYGIETGMPWGHDFGDSIMRHPVQLYESLSMLVFLAVILVVIKCRSDVIIRYGYYICVGFYAAQRFLWEFFKPYSDVIGTFNLFQWVCLALIIYSFAMILKAGNVHRTT